MAKDFRAKYCRYMPSEVCFWGRLLPDCYIVTNINVMCRNNKAACVCVQESIPRVHVNIATPVGDIFLVCCGGDMITLR